MTVSLSHARETPKPELPLLQHRTIDDLTLETLQRVYGMGVAQIQDSYEGLLSILPDQTAHFAAHSHKKICGALQVRPNAHLLNCCSAHDLLNWVELCVPADAWSEESLMPAAVYDGFRSKEQPVGDELAAPLVKPPTYLEVIERYLFEEERSAALAEATAIEAERRAKEEEEKALIASQKIHEVVDWKLLELAEEDGRRTVAAMAAFEASRMIIAPFVALCRRIASRLDLSTSHLPTNCLMAALVSLRCCPRLAHLSLARLQIDTPFAVLAFLGPVKHHLQQLESLVIDDNPIGSAAMNALLRVTRAHPTLCSVSFLGVSCDSAIARKVTTTCDIRKATVAKSKKSASQVFELTSIDEPSARRAITSDQSLEFMSVTARFLVEIHRASSKTVGHPE